jgi:hypothetical protein
MRGCIEWVVVAVVVVLIIGVMGSITSLASTDEVATPVVSIPPTQAAPTPTMVGWVSQDDLGDDWPLTVPNGRIECRDGLHIVIRTDRGLYPLNGSAASSGRYHDLIDIWRDHPDVDGMRVSLAPLLEIGRELCR